MLVSFFIGDSPFVDESPLFCAAETHLLYTLSLIEPNLVILSAPANIDLSLLSDTNTIGFSLAIVEPVSAFTKSYPSLK